MQSWGISSRFTQRDTGKEPSKSGVLGILAAAMGIERGDWGGLEPLTRLTMYVRHDRPGGPKRDYQTAGCATGDTIIKADGKPSDNGVVSERFYLADAAFLVVLSGQDGEMIQRMHAALRDPVWPLSLGRKSYVPSKTIWLPDGVQEKSPLEIIRSWPWLVALRPWEKRTPEQLLASSESGDGSGSLRMDQPLSSFAERRFGARFVRTEWIPFPGQVDHAVA